MSDQQINGDATKNGSATTGLVLGIIGLIAWFIPIIGAPITIVGLIFGIKGLKSLKHDLAIIGIVLCCIGLVAVIVNASIGAYMGATSLNNQNPQTKTTQTAPNNNNTSKAEIINKAVQALKTQMSLPYQIDEVTTLVDVTAEPGAIRYHYVLSDIDTSQITNDSLRNSIGLQICQNKETINLLNRDINMEYSYFVKNSAQKYFVSFTKVFPNSC